MNRMWETTRGDYEQRAAVLYADRDNDSEKEEESSENDEAHDRGVGKTGRRRNEFDKAHLDTTVGPRARAAGI